MALGTYVPLAPEREPLVQAVEEGAQQAPADRHEAEDEELLTSYNIG